LCHSSLQCSNLCHQFFQVSRTLALTMVISCKLWIQWLSLIFLQFFDECVLHFIEETTIELVPLSSFQITLFENSCLSEYIYFATYVKIPAVNHLTMISLLSWVNLLDIVLCVLNYDLVRLSIKSKYNCYLISLSVF